MATQPQVVLRAGWGAQPSKSPLTQWRSGKPTGDTDHWEGSGGQADHALCFAEVRAIQDMHLHNTAEGYIDIAYNWLICQHGVIFEGRGDAHSGAAQRAGNPERRSICYLGGPLTQFTNAGKLAFRWLHEQKLNPPDDRRAHRDEPSCATSCAGDEHEAWLRAGEPVSGAPAPQPIPAPAPKPLPPAGVHHPVLRQGNRGPAVLELQRKLNGAAGQHLSTDGVFGPKTDQAVRNFQAFFKLGVDGIAGPKTWGLLDYCAALHGIH